MLGCPLPLPVFGLGLFNVVLILIHPTLDRRSQRIRHIKMILNRILLSDRPTWAYPWFPLPLSFQGKALAF